MPSNDLYGPRTAFSQWIHSDRHRGPEESFDDYAVRYCRAVARDSKEQFYRTLHYVRHQAILPAGRQQVSVGRAATTTALNCFAGPVIPDSLQGIFDTLRQGAVTMGAGGGIGWDFSSIRPEGEIIRGLGGMGHASGPIHFMKPFDSMCKVLVRSWARGAMMGTLRVDHPDILKFVLAKRNSDVLNAFNISVCVTDNFMEALANDGLFYFEFEGRSFGQARAQDIWGPIMESNWDWAEPGVIFIDRVNRENPLYYAEQIYTTNPCAEQPLPPHGCCLLGSINLVKFLVPRHESLPKLDASNPNIVHLHQQHQGKDQLQYDLDWESLGEAVSLSVRAYDNVIDRTVYPLPEQEKEEKQKRRMGIGPTGMADALAIMGLPYASPQYLDMQDRIYKKIANEAYRTSAKLAREKKPFPLYDVAQYCEGRFFQRLDGDVQDLIVRHGLRNSHLTSTAPTGSISLDADNVSSGIEPIFSLRQTRKVDTVKQGIKEFELINYAYNFYNVEGRPASEVTPDEHVEVLSRAQYWTDSSISKTCNLAGQIAGQGPGTTFEDFEKIYLTAWEKGAKSCTTFNLNGKRAGILTSTDDKATDKDLNLPIATEAEAEALACFIDPLTGQRSCE